MRQQDPSHVVEQNVIGPGPLEAVAAVNEMRYRMNVLPASKEWWAKNERGADPPTLDSSITRLRCQGGTGGWHWLFQCGVRNNGVALATDRNVRRTTCRRTDIPVRPQNDPLSDGQECPSYAWVAAMAEPTGSGPHDHAQRLARLHQLESSCTSSSGRTWEASLSAGTCRGGEQFDGFLDVPGGRIAGADHAQLAVVNRTAIDVEHGTAGRQRGEQDHAAAFADQMHGLLLRCGGRSGHDRHIGPQAVGVRHHTLGQILLGRD